MMMVQGGLGGRRELALFWCPHTNLSGMISRTSVIPHDSADRPVAQIINPLGRETAAGYCVSWVEKIISCVGCVLVPCLTRSPLQPISGSARAKIAKMRIGCLSINNDEMLTTQC
jgi:hypothetical protein